MEDREKMLSNNTQSDDDSAARYKELFEYEMTQVRQMLEGEFGKLSSEDMNNAGKGVDSNPVNLTLEETEVVPANAEVGVTVPQVKKLYSADNGVAKVDGVTVSQFSNEEKALVYNGDNVSLQLDSNIRVEGSSKFEISLDGELKLEGTSVHIPSSSNLKFNIATADSSEVCCDIPTEKLSCDAVKPTNFNFEINTQPTVEKKNIDCVISSPEIAIEAGVASGMPQLVTNGTSVEVAVEFELPGEASGILVSDIKTDEAISFKADASPKSSLMRTNTSDAEITGISVEVPSVGKLSTTFESEPEVKAGEFNLSNVSHLEFTQPAEVSVGITAETTENAGKITPVPVADIEIESSQMSTNASDAEIAGNPVEAPYVGKLSTTFESEPEVKAGEFHLGNISQMEITQPTEVSVEITAENIKNAGKIAFVPVADIEFKSSAVQPLGDKKSPEYKNANVNVESFGISMEDSAKYPNYNPKEPTISKMPFTDTEIKKVVYLCSEAEIVSEGVALQALSSLEYAKNAEDISISTSIDVSAHKDLTYKAMRDVNVDPIGAVLSPTVALKCESAEFKVDESSIALPDKNISDNTIARIGEIASEIKIPRGLTYEEMCERCGADVDAAKFQLSVSDVLKSFRTEFGAQ